jgi:hypothetical protein
MMNNFRLVGGIVSLVFALLLYISGYTHFFFSVSENFLPSINLYPAGFLALFGTFLLVNELLRDINTSEM